MIDIINSDFNSVEWPNDVDLIVTSPPYKDEDNFSFDLIEKFAQKSYDCLKPNSLLFMNFGHLANFKSRPFECAIVMERIGFSWIDTITWVKNHYRPLQGNKRVNNLTEFIFMMGKGNPTIDRLSIGIPYEDKSNIKRWKQTGGNDLKCGGNIFSMDLDQEIELELELKKEPVYHKNRKYKINENYFDDFNDHSSYWLGFLWGDGYLSDTRSVGIELSAYDYIHLEKFKYFISSSQPLKFRTRNIFNKDHDTVILSLNSKILYNRLVSIGYSDKEIPDCDFEFIPFLRGLYDSDGSFCHSSRGFNFNLLGKEKLLNFILNKLIVDFGIETNANVVSRGGIYSLTISGKQVPKIMDLIYDNSEISLDRKREKYTNILSTSDLWKIPYDTVFSKSQKLHNDRFPTGLPEKCIKLSGISQGSLVVDPFSGSGTTALVARNLGMNFWGTEINKHHYETSIKRLNLTPQSTIVKYENNI